MNPTHNPPTTEVAEPTPAHILRAAALYLARHGWHQGDMYADAGQPTPPACAQGAIRMAVAGGPATAYTADTAWQVDTAVGELATWLADNHLDEDDFDARFLDQIIPGQLVGEWNDRPERTAQQVITALTAAADQWDRIHTATGGAR